MTVSLADIEPGEEQTSYDKADPEIERLRPQRVERSQVAGEPGGASDRHIAGKLVQSQCEAALARPDQINLHDDGHGPAQGLVHTEQDVSKIEPPPMVCPDEDER